MTGFSLLRSPLALLGVTTLALVAAALFPACSDDSDNRPGVDGNDHNITVMANHFHTPMSFSNALAGQNEQEILALRAQIHLDGVNSDFSGRIEELANRVDAERPDFLIMHAAQNPQFTGPVLQADALRNLEMMVAALSARGLNYSIVAERHLETYAEVALVPPACEMAEPVGACTTTPRFEDYVFVNNDNPRLVLTSVETHNFVNYWQLPVQVPLMSQHLYKGWTTVDGMIGERAFRLVDVYFTRATRGDLQVLQTQEIIAGPMQFDGPLIVSVNSKSTGDPSDDTTSTAYPMFLAAGLTDTWQNPDDPGYTCCQGFYLDNPESQLTRRDDYILVNELVETVDARLLGTTPFQETPPYWTGAHATSVVEVTIKGSIDN